MCKRRKSMLAEPRLSPASVSEWKKGAAMLCILSVFLGLIVLAQCLTINNGTNDCPPLTFASLKNGAITPTTQNGFRFSCASGHFLAGPYQLRCKRGHWIPPLRRPPKCLKSEGLCDPPPAVDHANILGSDYAVGSAVMYQCHDGYRMLGKSRRTCERNLAWSGLTPVCQAEEEPLQNIAVRLDKEFIKNVGSHSNDSRARSLDAASLQKGLELVILLDRSSSVDPVDFKMGVEFIKFLFREFGVRNGDNPVGTRAAVVTFGNEAEVVFNLDSQNISSPEKANKEMDALQAEGGGTAMVPAMTTVFIDIAPLLRPEAKRALFLITDGEPNVEDDITPEDAAAQLKRAQDFEIFTVGIGKGINTDLLTSIASDPPEGHVFILKKYSQLRDMISVIKTLPEERPKPGPEKCGFIDESLKPTEYERWPWLAAVYTSFPPPEAMQPGPFKMSFCAGVLICDDWVLTAASCFHETNRRDVILSLQEVFVVMGEHDLLEIDNSRRNYYAKDVQTHPDFDPFNPLENNLALVQLNEAVPLNIMFRPICLPRTDLVIPLHEDLTTNTSTAGWGRPLKRGFTSGINAATTDYTLRTKTIAMAEEGECLRRLKRKSLGSVFCAGVGESDCLGNIGSPILGQDRNTQIQHVLGILTDKSDCNQGYSKFIDLRQYLPWIDAVTHNCRLRHEM